MRELLEFRTFYPKNIYKTNTEDALPTTKYERSQLLIPQCVHSKGNRAKSVSSRRVMPKHYFQLHIGRWGRTYCIYIHNNLATCGLSKCLSPLRMNRKHHLGDSINGVRIQHIESNYSSQCKEATERSIIPNSNTFFKKKLLIILKYFENIKAFFKLTCCCFRFFQKSNTLGLICALITPTKHFTRPIKVDEGWLEKNLPAKMLVVNYSQSSFE